MPCLLLFGGSADDAGSGPDGPCRAGRGELSLGNQHDAEPFDRRTGAGPLVCLAGK